jgi:hypothetical protein
MKTCPGCRTEKSLSDFYLLKSSKDGLSRKCKQCTKADVYAWRDKNRDKANESVRNWGIANRERKNESIAAWRAANPERVRNTQRAAEQKYRESNVDKVREKCRKWEKQNPHKRGVITSKRRSAKLNATPAWADHNAIRTLYEKAHEFSMPTGERWEVDHVVPLRSNLVCGLHCEANLQLLVKELNASKKNYHWPDMP